MPAPKIIPRYTAEDYRQWDGDWELWDGIPIAMTPSPFGPHQKLLARLTQRILNALESAGCNTCEVVVELDWIVDRHTVVRPDLSVLCGMDVDQFIEQPPALIVEVLSPSTSWRDRNEKRALYEQKGVAHYLMAETDPVAFELQSLDSTGHYQTIDVSDRLTTLRLGHHCTLKIDLENF